MKKSLFITVKHFTFYGALVGLVAGILYSVGGLIIDVLVTVELIQTTGTPGLSWGTVLAFGALVGMPLIGAVAGAILGVLWHGIRVFFIVNNN